MTLLGIGALLIGGAAVVREIRGIRSDKKLAELCEACDKMITSSVETLNKMTDAMIESMQ